MQRIELNSELLIPRCLQDLTTYLQTQPSTAQLLTYIEALLEQGYDTYLIPTQSEILAVLDDLLLQRPYLKNQLQFICLITPFDEQGYAKTQPQSIEEEVLRICQQLDGLSVTIGLVNGKDLLFDPVATAQILEQLQSEKRVKTFGVSEVNDQQLEILQHYSEQLIELRIYPFDYQFVSQFSQQAVCFQYQMFPLMKMPTVNLAEQDEVIVQLAKTMGISYEAIILAWLLAHPITIMPIFDNYLENKWQKAYKEQQNLLLTRMQWYEINERFL